MNNALPALTRPVRTWEAVRHASARGGFMGVPLGAIPGPPKVGLIIVASLKAGEGALHRHPLNLRLVT